MLLACVETSTARSSVALVGDDEVLAAASLGRDRRHGEFVAPALQQCLAHLGAGVGDLTGVVAGTGPGLYTGLRVGLVTAATLAATLDLPALGVPGPDALAHRARHGDRDVVVVLDARRREVFHARYAATPEGGRRRVGELAVADGATAAAALAAHGGPVLLVGDGLHRLDGHLDGLDVVRGGDDLRHPEAADLGLLARPRFLAGDTVAPDQLRPLYLRDADAAIPWDARSRLAGGAGGG